MGTVMSTTTRDPSPDATDTIARRCADVNEEEKSLEGHGAKSLETGSDTDRITPMTELQEIQLKKPPDPSNPDEIHEVK